MPSVIVNSLPNCQQCKAVKRWLNKEGLAYTEVDLSTEPDKAAAFKEAGFSGAPITEVEGYEPFYGYDIAKLIEYLT